MHKEEQKHIRCEARSPIPSTMYHSQAVLPGLALMEKVIQSNPTTADSKEIANQ